MIGQLTHPEGPERRCPICNHLVRAEPSLPSGDAPCPRCGHLLWWIRGHVSQSFGIPEEKVVAEASFIDDLTADSLDIVELVMAFEDEFDITIADEDHDKIRTVGDAIRYIEEAQRISPKKAQ